MWALNSLSWTKFSYESTGYIHINAHLVWLAKGSHLFSFPHLRELGGEIQTKFRNSNKNWILEIEKIVFLEIGKKIEFLEIEKTKNYDTEQTEFLETEKTYF